MGRRVLVVGSLAFSLIGESAWGGWTMNVPKAPPPGQSVRCPAAPPGPDFKTDCENCRDLELVKCDIYLGDETMGNKMVFTVKNHNTKYARRSDSARFGHVGIGPGGGGVATDPPIAPVSAISTLGDHGFGGGISEDLLGKRVFAPETSTATSTATAEGYDAAPTVTLDIPSSATPKFPGELPEYPSGPPPAVHSESMPDSFSVGPQETKTLEVDAITDFPVISQCQDIVYMAVHQQGQLETPYLWNRNYPCTVKPCYELGFRQCTMHRGAGGAGGSAPPAATEPAPPSGAAGPIGI